MRDTQHVVPKRKAGGQPGNRNAFKTGRHVKSNRDLRSEIGKLKHGIRGALKLAETALAAAPRAEAAAPYKLPPDPLQPWNDSAKSLRFPGLITLARRLKSPETKDLRHA